MRVLIFHGYLLRGTGSNVYNASLARALAGLGHDVHLLCQERDAGALAWVDAVGRWEGGRLRVELGDGAEATGSVTAYLPEIGGLLPVYVADRYEGFEVKTFPELTDAELERYLDANVAAVREVATSIGGVEAALANHLVMGPAILARAGLGGAAGGPGFAAKVHGSALEYTVRPNREHFLALAREGMAAASGVLVGSRHTAESLWETVDEPSLPGRTRLGPPGVDSALFAPRERAEAVTGLRDLARGLAALGDASGELGRNGAAAATALEHFAAASGPRVVFVGKLIVSKGVDLLLVAWPLVVARNPGARLLIVGFGEFQAGLERLSEALGRGDIEAARGIAAAGRALEGGERHPLAILSSFLASSPVGYAQAARNAAGSVAFAGRLEHNEVANVVPAAEALVFPSTFPEAFGMVAAEAAAAGVLPVSADHSGLREVSRQLAAELPPAVAEIVSFPLGEGAVAAIAERLTAWFATEPATRAATRRALRQTVARLWSWEGVARGVLAASAGRLDELPPIAGD